MFNWVYMLFPCLLLIIFSLCVLNSAAVLGKGFCVVAKGVDLLLLAYCDKKIV